MIIKYDENYNMFVDDALLHEDKEGNRIDGISPDAFKKLTIENNKLKKQNAQLNEVIKHSYILLKTIHAVLGDFKKYHGDNKYKAIQVINATFILLDGYVGQD